jgi:anaerobic selenocysteine-containing dehydrogenase
LVVIDPLRTKIAEQADLHLSPYPGTDVLLGFALAVELERLGAHDKRFIAEHVGGYEEYMQAARAWPAEAAAGACRIRVEDIRQLAGWMVEADPLVVAPGNGLERGRNGGSGIRAAIALPALIGKLGARSGVVLGAGNAFPKTPKKLTRSDLVPPGTRTLNILDIGRYIERDDIDPPLRALFIYNHNPIVVHPGPEPDQEGPAPRGNLLCGHRDRHDRDHAALRYRATGGNAFRMRRSLCRLWPPLAAAGRSRHSAARRIAPEHGNLPQARRSLRV